MGVQGPNSYYDFVGTFTTSIRPTAAIDPSAQKTGGRDKSADVPAARVSVSPWGQALSKLQRLHDDAPATFKAVLGHMADTVSAAADKATGDDKKELAKLSQKLSETAKSGDLSVFHPTHHHHKVAAAQGAPTMLQTLLDQIDHVLGPDASSPTSQG